MSTISTLSCTISPAGRGVRLGHAIGQVLLGLGAAAREQAQLGMHEGTARGDGADVEAAVAHGAALEIGLVEHLGAGTDGGVELGERLRLGVGG